MSKKAYPQEILQNALDHSVEMRSVLVLAMGDDGKVRIAHSDVDNADIAYMAKALDFFLFNKFQKKGIE